MAVSFVMIQNNYDNWENGKNQWKQILQSNQILF